MFLQARFFITVKKNYRSVAYHNWSHGFHVANSIYCILKHSPGKFNMLEVRFLRHWFGILITKLPEFGHVHWSFVSWSWSQRLQQQVHDWHWLTSGCYLLHLHHGAPPLQHDHHHPAAGEPQHLLQAQPWRIQTSSGKHEALYSCHWSRNGV